MEKHIEVLEKILNGYHPVTGEIFSDDHVFCEPDVIRALHHAISAMKNTEQNETGMRSSLPMNRLSSKREWTEDDDRLLCTLYRQNMPLKEIANRLSRRTRGIEKRLKYLKEVKRQQIDRKKYEDQADLNQAVLYNRNAPWMKEDEDKLLEMFNARIAISEIAARLGRTRKAIEYRMIHMGLIEKQGQYVEGIRPWTSRDSDLLRTLYADGIDISLIAARFETSEKAIKARLFYMGITRESPKLFPEKNGDRIEMEEGEDK